MAIEIERKYLVADEGWRPLVRQSLECRQGYLDTGSTRLSVRVRILGRDGYLTLKGSRSGLARSEFEYPIPLADAGSLLEEFCSRNLIVKVRHLLDFDGREWEIDEFGGENLGLILAEVELDSETETVRLPDWIGREVSDNPRYFNAQLCRHPWSTWPPEER